MSRECPRLDEWVRYVDGEVTANRARALEAHADGCSQCHRRLDELRGLTTDIAAPLAEPDPEAVARVMRQVGRAPSPAPQRWSRRPVLALSGAVALAAAAAALLLVTRATPDDTYQARGGARVATLKRNVGLFLYADGQRLEQRASVAPRSEYRLGYTNLFQDPRDTVYLLLFAVDASGDVHWLFPGFSDPATDPEAVLLASAGTEVVLPETVVLETLEPGPLRVVAILGADPMSVSAIESLEAAQLSVPSLQARWREVEIRELTLRVER